jgi:hypothetical protein
LRAGLWSLFDGSTMLEARDSAVTDMIDAYLLGTKVLEAVHVGLWKYKKGAFYLSLGLNLRETDDTTGGRLSVVSLRSCVNSVRPRRRIVTYRRDMRYLCNLTYTLRCWAELACRDGVVCHKKCIRMSRLWYLRTLRRVWLDSTS